jgi:hypothetical protein
MIYLEITMNKKQFDIIDISWIEEKNAEGTLDNQSSEMSMPCAASIEENE